MAHLVAWELAGKVPVLQVQQLLRIMLASLVAPPPAGILCQAHLLPLPGPIPLDSPVHAADTSCRSVTHASFPVQRCLYSTMHLPSCWESKDGRECTSQGSPGSRQHLSEAVAQICASPNIYERCSRSTAPSGVTHSSHARQPSATPCTVVQIHVRTA